MRWWKIEFNYELDVCVRGEERERVWCYPTVRMNILADVILLAILRMQNFSYVVCECRVAAYIAYTCSTDNHLSIPFSFSFSFSWLSCPFVRWWWCSLSRVVWKSISLLNFLRHLFRTPAAAATIVAIHVIPTVSIHSEQNTHVNSIFLFLLMRS